MLEGANPKAVYDDKHISNIINQARADKRAAVNAQGGQVNSLLNKLGELNEKEKGWFYMFWHNSENRVGRFFWMSPHQIALTKIFIVMF
jgi:hypothetical protein